MCRCLRHLADTLRIARPVLTYHEDGARGEAALIDAVAYCSAKDDDGRRKAVLWAGRIPPPTPDELRAALHVLHYGGIREGGAYREAWLREVVSPALGLGPQDQALCQHILKNYRRHYRGSDVLRDLYALHAEGDAAQPGAAPSPGAGA